MTGGAMDLNGTLTNAGDQLGIGSDALPSALGVKVLINLGGATLSGDKSGAYFASGGIVTNAGLIEGKTLDGAVFHAGGGTVSNLRSGTFAGGSIGTCQIQPHAFDIYNTEKLLRQSQPLEAHAFFLGVRHLA